MAGKRPDRKTVSEKNQKKWVATVHTDSPHPPKGLFTRSAIAIARALASKKVSRKAPDPACAC